MLRANLSTQPFYNTRAVRAGLIGFAVIAAALTVFNSLDLWRLQRATRELGQVVTENENTARELRQKARTVQQALDKTALSQVAAAAREANELINRRAFSWTELLNQFQATLPPTCGCRRCSLRLTATAACWSPSPCCRSNRKIWTASSRPSRRRESSATSCHGPIQALRTAP